MLFKLCEEGLRERTNAGMGVAFWEVRDRVSYELQELTWEVSGLEIRGGKGGAEKWGDSFVPIGKPSTFLTKYPVSQIP